KLFPCPATQLRAKTTHSIHLANKENKSSSSKHIAAIFQQYSHVFSETASYRLPNHQPWDHAIDLKPDAKPWKSWLYTLTPVELAAEDTYIKEHLFRGYIHPSKSPFASPFFF